jgi:hypothetical protein
VKASNECSSTRKSGSNFSLPKTQDPLMCHVVSQSVNKVTAQGRYINVLKE